MEPNYVIIGIVVLIVIIGVILMVRKNQKEQRKLTQMLNDDYVKDPDLEDESNDQDSTGH